MQHTPMKTINEFENSYHGLSLESENNVNFSTK